MTGVTAVGNSSTAQIVFTEDTYTFGGGATTFTVISSGDFDLNKGATTTFTTAGTAITFAGGDIDLANGSNVTVESAGGAISVAGISGTSDEIVILNANAGGDSATETVSLGNVGDSSQTEIHNLTVTANDGITLTGAIYTSDDDTSNGDIVFNDAVAINGNVTIDSDDGVITFTTSIDGADGTGDNLTIDGGTGTITLQVIGATTSLTSLNINTDAGSTANLTVPNIGAGSAGVTGATAIGNTNTGTLTLSGTVYKTDGTQTYTAATGGGNIDITGAATFTTSADNISFNTLSLIHI